MMVSILSIVWYKVLPARFGGQKGIAHFNAHLAKHHPLTCLCSKNNDPGGELSYKILPLLPENKTQFLLPSCHRLIKRIALQEKPTHIILEHPYHGIAATAAAGNTGAALVVHSHNIESQRFRQIGKWWWPLLYRYEKWVHRRAALSLFKTEEDQQWAITHFKLEAEKCMIVPYGVEQPSRNEDAGTIIRRRHNIAPAEKIILFAGTLDYQPNARAVEDIYRHIAPLLPAGYKIIVCGRNRFTAFHYLNNLSHPAVVQAGEVMDIEDYFSAADAFINPVQTGGGIQTKIVDALSYHCNVAAFRGNLSGISTTAQNKLFVADEGNWRQFTEQVILACKNSIPTPPAFFEEHDQARIAATVSERLQAITQPATR